MAELADAADLKSAAFGRGGSIPPSGIETALLLLILVAAFLFRAWFGHFDPSSRRFFDERYALENVGKLLRTGEPRPANGYHPTLSYLPQVALQGALQAAAELSGEKRLAPLAPYAVFEYHNRPDRYPFTKTAFLAGRWMQALLGTLAVALAFALGRLLGGPATGLVAATLVAAAPQLVRRSVIINEDAILAATVLGATLAAAVAGARRSLRSYLVAGLAVGLACASKFNGVAAACPLVAVTLAQGRDARAWARLAAAGGAAILTFLLLNPFVLTDFDLYRTDFGRTMRDYGEKGELQRQGRAAVLVSGFASVLEPTFLGPVGGAAALLGLALLARRAWRGTSVETRAAAQAILGYAIGYPLLYSIATRNVSLHNWSPLLPLMAIAAALVASELAHAVAARARWRPAAALVATVLALGLATPAVALTYGWMVPSTVAVAGDRLATHLDAFEGRMVLAQDDLGTFRVRRKAGLRPTVVRAGSPGREAGEAAATVDALVLRRDETHRSPELRGLAARGRLVEVVEPRLGLARGPALSIYLMGWRRAGPARPIELACVRRRGWVGTLPGPPAGVVSLSLWWNRDDPVTAALVAGRQVRLRRALVVRERALLYSEKVDLRPAGADARIEIAGRCPARATLDARVLGWTRESPAGEATPDLSAGRGPRPEKESRPSGTQTSEPNALE